MFQKETITGADLLSVQFWGYYEGAPQQAGELENRGTFNELYYNSVLFSTTTYPDDVMGYNVLCSEDDTKADAYREGCTVVTVRSNEWMAEHVMPYLYYFKNAKAIAFGYCWTMDIPVIPIATECSYFSTHGRFAHEPYDPLYE